MEEKGRVGWKIAAILISKGRCLYMYPISPGLMQLTRKLTELTPGHWFFATPISLGLSRHVWCPSHLLRTASSRLVRCGQVWAAGVAGPPSAFNAASPATFIAPSRHRRTSDLAAAAPRLSVQYTTHHRKMRFVATRVAWSMCLSVCLSRPPSTFNPPSSRHPDTAEHRT